MDLDVSFWSNLYRASVYNYMQALRVQQWMMNIMEKKWPLTWGNRDNLMMLQTLDPRSCVTEKELQKPVYFLYTFERGHVYDICIYLVVIEEYTFYTPFLKILYVGSQGASMNTDKQENELHTGTGDRQEQEHDEFGNCLHVSFFSFSIHPYWLRRIVVQNSHPMMLYIDANCFYVGSHGATIGVGGDR